MATQIRLRASITALIAAVVVAVASASHFASDGSAAGPTSADIDVVAIDANPTGNSARTVGAAEECVSTTVGQPVDIDIVVPGPGIPSNRGIAAYQFSILYDPTVVWIGTDDSEMLLAQAAGSSIIPIADPKPDRNGVYQSWGIDFGPEGIEPAGSSETGPGVIARITLLPQSEGVSALTLSNVLVIDDASERISLESVQSGTIHVGEPCAGPNPNTILSPDNDDSGENGDSDVAAAMSPPALDQDTDGDGYSDNDEIAQGSDPLDASSTPEASPPAEVPNGGGLPPPKGDISFWLAVSGLIATLAGAALLVAGRLAFKGQARAALPLGGIRRDASADGDSVKPRIRRE